MQSKMEISDIQTTRIVMSTQTAPTRTSMSVASTTTLTLPLKNQLNCSRKNHPNTQTLAATSPRPTTPLEPLIIPRVTHSFPLCITLRVLGRMMPSSSSTRVGIVEKKSPMSRTQGISANSEAFILEKPSSAPRSTHNLLKQFLVDAHKPCHKDFGYSGPTSNHSSQRQIHTLSTIQRSHKRLPEVSIDLPLYTNSRQLGSGASSKERALSISESRTSLGKLKVVSPQILDGEMSFPVTARASGHQFTYPFLQPASGDAVVYGAAIHVPFPSKIQPYEELY